MESPCGVWLRRWAGMWRARSSGRFATPARALASARQIAQRTAASTLARWMPPAAASRWAAAGAQVTSYPARWSQLLGWGRDDAFSSRAASRATQDRVAGRHRRAGSCGRDIPPASIHQDPALREGSIAALPLLAIHGGSVRGRPARMARWPSDRRTSGARAQQRGAAAKRQLPHGLLSGRPATKSRPPGVARRAVFGCASGRLA